MVSNINELMSLWYRGAGSNWTVAAGKYPNLSIVHKFGRNPAIGTTFAPVCMGGVYQTPQYGSATTLRIAAGGDANDTAAGSGARSITLQGLDETGALVSETIATAGASASSATTTTFSRLFRFYVEASGTYATASAGSHADDITIENGAGGTTWGVIDATSFPQGQSEVGAYTVPAGYTGYITEMTMISDATKPTDILLFQRKDANQTAAPYSRMSKVMSTDNLTVMFNQNHINPLGPFPAHTDLGFMAKVAIGTASVAVDFEILLVAD